jgi:hypothetical protein
MDVLDTQPLEEVQIDDEFKCTVCHDLLVNPVTLLCQHTFCRLCIKSYVASHNKPQIDDAGYPTFVSRDNKNAKCPLCRCAIVIPPNDNFLVKDLISKKYPELYKSRMEEHQKDTLKLDIRSQIEDEIRTEVFGAVVDEAVHENNDNAQAENNDRERGTHTYVNIPDNSHWITKVFPSRATLTIGWVLLLATFAVVMVKLGVSPRTYLGVCMIMWGIYVYLINQY